MRYIMKTLILAGFAAMLTACGGGGSDAVVPTCTYPTAEAAAPLVIATSGSTQAISDTSQRLTINLTGSGNTIKLDRCVYVSTLTVSGNTNTVKSDDETMVKAVTLGATSSANTVEIPASSKAVVTDQGSINTVRTF